MKIKYSHDKTLHNKSAAREILPFIFSITNPANVLDIGCGTGSWLSVAKELGVGKVVGIDGILVSENLLEIEKEEFLKHDLSSPLILQEKFDITFCLEVAEHLPSAAADIIVNTLTSSSDFILFSAAIPGQGGQFHINEQQPDYWREKFAAKGFLPYDILKDKFWQNEKVDWWYKQNIVIYGKPGKLENLNYLPSEQILSKIHPELLQVKINEINNLQQLTHDKVWNPKFIYSLKLVMKSIFNAFRR